ncbi:MAG: AraC family transcriptional regulator [Pseudomonadota bacterium]
MDVSADTSTASSDKSPDGRRWKQVRPGMHFGVLDMQLDEPLHFESRTFPAVCLSVVLEGYATNNMEQIEGGFCPNEVWVTSTGDVLPTSMTIHADRPVQVVELLLTPEYAEEGAQFSRGDPALENLIRAMSQPLMIRRHKLDARLREIAWSALNPPFADSLAEVHLEACALNMLCILVEYFQSAEDSSLAELPKGKALERMLDIRRFIDFDPVAVKSLADLAVQFGISQSGLKRDFQLAFGVSARDYLLERRMLIGRNAILRDRVTISEAAYRAGYQHPSNFTAAFTKHFGYPPSALKN